GQVEALKQRFHNLEEALKKTEVPRVFSAQVDPRQVADAIRVVADDLVEASRDLRNLIETALFERIQASKTDYKISFGIVTSTSVLAVLMMAGLLRFFYR